MKFSKGTDYALHLVEALAAQEGNRSVSALAEELGASPAYLSKILTQLAKAGIVGSVPGIGGGYRLRQPETVTFLDVVRAVEGGGPLFETELPHDAPCRIQAVMAEAAGQMERYLAGQRLSDLQPRKAEAERRRGSYSTLKKELL